MFVLAPAVLAAIFHVPVFFHSATAAGQWVPLMLGALVQLMFLHTASRFVTLDRIRMHILGIE